MKASADRHVNHSLNDEAAQAERQGDPHSHAIVLEPTAGTIAYVPDLGMDVIRQVPTPGLARSCPASLLGPLSPLSHRPSDSHLSSMATFDSFTSTRSRGPLCRAAR